MVVKEAGAWPRVATTTFQFDPHRGDLLARDGYDQLSPARKLRLWSRYLHTGEALGRPAQAIAGLASLGGFALVLTGFALAYRRLRGKSNRDKTSTSSENSSGV